MSKILIIEDNEMNIKVFKELLIAKEYNICIAEDGQEGLNKAFEEDPDLIILDIQLPKMNGIDIARIIKSEKATKDIPIIAVTAFSSESDKNEILQVGCDAFITKPFRIPHLLQTIEDLIIKK